MKNKRNGSGWKKNSTKLCKKPKVSVRKPTYAWESRIANKADEWEVAQMWCSLLNINHSKYKNKRALPQHNAGLEIGDMPKAPLSPQNISPFIFMEVIGYWGDGWIDR